MRFDYIIKHVPGKSLHTADALSRAPLEYTVDSDKLMEIQKIECHISTISQQLLIPYLSAVLDYRMEGNFGGGKRWQIWQ